MGILIAFEGIDGAGKTTQVQLLGRSLQAAGEDVVLSKEPTDGPWGRQIRESAQNGRMPIEEEIRAFVEDRKEHIEHTIRPGLESGKIVILDRYFYSTIAYQGARGADRQQLTDFMKSFAPIPNVVFLLDVEPLVALSRIANDRGDTPNEFERADQLAVVRGVFEWLAESDDHISTINGHRPIEDIHRTVIDTLLEGVFKSYRPKQYDCDCCYCSYRDSECRWFALQQSLRSSARACLSQQ